MELKVNGYENNHPVLTTYCVSDNAVAEAVATSDVGYFDVTEGLDTDKQYVLIDKSGDFFGLIMFWVGFKSAVITTLVKSKWKPGAEFYVHDIEKKQ